MTDPLLPDDLSRHFSRFLTAEPDRLHAAAHSHHPWPDVTFGAHQRSWIEAARRQDAKWDRIFERVVPEAREHVAGRLGLPDPGTVALAPNTHELVMRVICSLEPPLRVLTTAAEFHSFERQARRLQEAGRAQVRRVPVRPYGAFPERLAAAAREGGWDLVVFSDVHFDSGFVHPDLAATIAAVADDTPVIVDGYHRFMALPVDLGALADRVFYVAGGYKYAMAGEGACFMHCPPGWIDRPVDTGWFAGFSALEDEVADRVAYGPGGDRFWGATFDPTGLERLNAAQRWFDELGLTVATVHAHVRDLQARLLGALDDSGSPHLGRELLVPSPPVAERGNFLAFATPRAADLRDELAARDVVVDVRGDRLRVGLGCYHDAGDVDELAARLTAAAGALD